MESGPFFVSYVGGTFPLPKAHTHAQRRNETIVAGGNRRICVYCGSKAGSSPAYGHAAAALGAVIVRRGLGLVYGGGNVGLMACVAESVIAAGGEVTGVIPRKLRDWELAHTGVAELIVAEDMHERKAIMAQRADAFVALPGGYGTLEELFEAVAWAQLGYHDKPVGLLNAGGYFDHLIAFLDHATREQFLRPHHRQLLQVASDPEMLLDSMLPPPDPARANRG